MKLNYRDLSKLVEILNKISIDKDGQERKMPLSLKIMILKMLKALNNDFEIFSKMRLTIFEEYGETLENNTIQIKPENEQKFKERMNELLENEIEIELPLLDLSLLEPLGIDNLNFEEVDILLRVSKDNDNRA